MSLSGYDSETERRDAVRRQIVQLALTAINDLIESEGVTHSPEERAYLLAAISHAISNRAMIDLRQRMWISETHAAEAEIDT